MCPLVCVIGVLQHARELVERYRDDLCECELFTACYLLEKAEEELLDRLEIDDAYSLK